MNRRWLPAVLALLAVPGQTAAFGSPDLPVDRLLTRVRALTAPELAGRGSGTPESAAAADSLASWLALTDWRPAFADSWWQTFALRGEGWTGNDLSGQRDRNVAAVWPGAGDLAGRWVILGAHYDHLGRLDPASGGSGPAAAGEYYPGANDNASGVAIVLDLVERLQTSPPAAVSRRSVLAVFFAGEEVGLQGSTHFVANPPVPLDSVDVMINFDTVGQITDRRLYVSGLGTAEGLPELVALADNGDLQLTLGQGGWSGSDHMSFNTREVPVLFVFGGPYPQYNRPTDIWQSLTADGLADVADFGWRLVASAVVRPGSLSWRMVATREVTAGESGGTNRTTWFGSLPDFTEEVPGYPLAGVFDDSPAARAGLQKGDVLVRFGGVEVVDLAGFTGVLRAHDPGDLVEVEVLRDGQRLRFTVVLGDRSERE